MAAMKHKGKHLTANHRCIILERICEGVSKAEIASRIGADPTTIAKEISNHRKLIRGTHLSYDT